MEAFSAFLLLRVVTTFVPGVALPCWARLGGVRVALRQQPLCLVSVHCVQRHQFGGPDLVGAESY